MSQCAGYDLANMPVGEGDGCWCQKSMGIEVTTELEQPSSGYKTCRVVALNTTNNTSSDTTPSVGEDSTPEYPDTCLSPWVETTEWAHGEKLIGYNATK